MVEMYLWLVVTVVVAVGVLVLAGIVSPGEPADHADDPDDLDGADESAPRSAWTSLWWDFRSGASALRARLDRLRRRGGPAKAEDGPRRVSALAAAHPESNTSFDEFFEATATSEPAYLDSAQLSDALHHLRR